MDPAHLRPWDVCPILDDNSHRQHNTNLSYQDIFAARVTNLLEERRQIYKRALLNKLYRLRQLVVSANETGEDTVLSDSLPDSPAENVGAGTSNTSPAAIAFQRKSLLLHGDAGRYSAEQQDAPSDSPPRDTPAENVRAGNSDKSPTATALPKKSLLLHDDAGQHSAEQHDSNSHSLPNDSTEGSTPETRIPDICNASQMSSQLGGELPSHMGLCEKPASSTFHKISASISSPLEISVQRFPVINDVISKYRYFKEMSQTYSSTVSPFFVTYPAEIFSATARAQHQLDPNTFPDRKLSLHPNPQSQPFPIVPKLPSLHRFPAPFCKPSSIPSLLARLFFEQEVSLLFDSQLRYTYSAGSVSLAKATHLYGRQLLSASHTPSMSLAASGSSQLELQQVSTVATTVSPHDASAKTSLTSPPSALFFSKEVQMPRDPQAFQRRTFYGSVTQTAEFRAPTAAWHDDTSWSDVNRQSASPIRSHYAYAVGADIRALPSYMNLQGVHSGHGSASVTLAFGFQRRTNYPFRRTYRQKRTVEELSVRPKIPPIVSGDFASRVPVSGLSSTLLHLFPPDVHRGLFFGKGQDESLLELEDIHTEKSYTINAEGKLVQEHAK